MRGRKWQFSIFCLRLVLIWNQTSQVLETCEVYILKEDSPKKAIFDRMFKNLMPQAWRNIFLQKRSSPFFKGRWPKVEGAFSLLTH
jgi:hypothetical protein